MERRVALVVEHDRATRELISQLLRARGYETEVAGTYALALSLFEARSPRVVVIDPVLSDGDGLEVVRRAKAVGVRVVITSAFPTGVEGAAAKFDVPLVPKPFEIDQLMAQVE